MQKIELRKVCPEAIAMVEELERLHYESTTKERIVGVALGSANVNSALVENYYQDYLKTYREYDRAKQKFFDTYVSKYVTSTSSVWEINFYNGELTIHD